MKLKVTFLTWRRAVGIRCYEIATGRGSSSNTYGLWSYRKGAHPIFIWLAKTLLGKAWSYQIPIVWPDPLEDLQNERVSVTVKGLQQIFRLHDSEVPE